MKKSQLLARLFVFCIVMLLLLPVATSAKEGGSDFSQAELAQMLAPVALYPDVLLSQVLMAATYPLEVVEADRWLRKNSLLQGDNLDEALRGQDWDASVKALCHVPTLLGLMSERLVETTSLGDAFLAQEKAVMDTIQDLRARAMQEGNLRSDDKQKVTIQDDGAIVIEPADSEALYLPYYNTDYVYGPWWYPAWPPWYWGPGDVRVGAGVYFWPDFFFGFGLGYWSYFDWPGRTIIIDVRRRPRFFQPTYDWDSHRGSWRHEPRHRLGVVYRDRPTAERFGQPLERVRRAERRAARVKVRGPVTGSGGSIVKSVEPKKSGAKPTNRWQDGKRLPDTAGGNLTGQPERPRVGGVTARGLETSPRAGSSHPDKDRRGQANTAEPIDRQRRELGTEPDGGSGAGRDSRHERPGSTAREGRQWNTPDGGGGRGTGERGGFVLGGRR